ncbi:hypothetical protein HNQ91_004536 [Filimonas zeae]|uniref:SusD family protein n=1 Tax=Filimonas zeae TaxID=1737353 RepID=A0A917J2H4_9BACT|nr:hypothetical protein [Filimonas zeae]MDR6341463.1 hypothetical protein [Filimonas zeae]GGH75748.1 hypothetical protein GCM10011379_39630 [Filimonas zeae]
MKFKIAGLFLIASSLSVLQSCKKDLDVVNKNEPDFQQVYASGDDLESLTSNLYNTIYDGTHMAGGVAPMLATAADNVSCSWGNYAMRDMSWEPRNNAWVNTAAYSYNTQTYDYFNKMYAAINTASNVLKAIEGGTNIGAAGAGNARARAFSKFIQGVAYGNLAFVFDKAFLVDEKIDIPDATVADAIPYGQIAAAAVAYLDTAIAIATANSFSVPLSWLGAEADFSSADFVKLCNTHAARILSYTPRNKTELAAVNWAKVKAYADAGISSDFNVVMDNYAKWYDEAGDYLTYQGWGVTDMYVVHMMDPVTQPAHWDDNASFPYPPVSTNPADKRLLSDFEYVSSNWFQVARGYYHFSSYRSKRYDALYVNADAAKGEVMKAENDMLRAEARVYTNDLAGAAAIINTSTRKTRGQMADVAADLNALVQAIHHERHVELYVTGFGIQFFEMRKLNLLQKGTPLHLPLPAQTLETFGEVAPYYTFGTVAKADGINVSNAGWR